MSDRCEYYNDRPIWGVTPDDQARNCMMRLAHARVMNKRGLELNEQDMMCLACKKNTGGKVMPAKKKDTVCELCGQIKNCRRAYDMWVCSMCMSVASTVKKRPDVVRAAWKRFGPPGGDLPEQATFIPAANLVPANPFDALLKRMSEIHNAKKLDYASNEDPLGNFREAERLGIPPHIGIMVRLTDKYSRACNLIRRNGDRAVKDEKLEDTLLDLANYALLALLAYNEQADSREWNQIERQRDNRKSGMSFTATSRIETADPSGKETQINILTQDELAGNVTGKEPKNGTLTLGKIDNVAGGLYGEGTE